MSREQSQGELGHVGPLEDLCGPTLLFVCFSGLFSHRLCSSDESQVRKGTQSSSEKWQLLHGTLSVSLSSPCCPATFHGHAVSDKYPF